MAFDGLQDTVNIQKPNTKMLCVHFPKREPMIFIRFSKGHLTHKILGTTEAKRKNFVNDFVCKFPREGHLMVH